MSWNNRLTSWHRYNTSADGKSCTYQYSQFDIYLPQHSHLTLWLSPCDISYCNRNLINMLVPYTMVLKISMTSTTPWVLSSITIIPNNKRISIFRFHIWSFKHLTTRYLHSVRMPRTIRIAHCSPKTWSISMKILSFYWQKREDMSVGRSDCSPIRGSTWTTWLLPTSSNRTNKLFGEKVKNGQKFIAMMTFGFINNYHTNRTMLHLTSITIAQFDHELYYCTPGLAWMRILLFLPYP